jgi:excisionase family DNA binding protein
MDHIVPNNSPLGLSTSQAAQALGVSLGTIRRWSDLGYLQSYRTPGGQRRFSQDQIDRFVGSLQSGSYRDRDQGSATG